MLHGLRNLHNPTKHDKRELNGGHHRKGDLMRLAIDLGTTTGFAYSTDKGDAIIIGSWNFKPGRHESEGVRYLKFRRELEKLHEAVPITAVWFEAVERHAGTIAAHVYGGLRATLLTWCETNRISYEGVPVGAIKKFWTGKGNADKAMMVEEAMRLGHEVADDNEADAVALVHWSLLNRPGDGADKGWCAKCGCGNSALGFAHLSHCDAQ